MAGPLYVDAGELPAEEIIDALNEGRRIVIRTELLGESHEVTLRFDEGIYYCDTPTTLHKHATEEEMRVCIDKHGYAMTERDPDS